MDNATVTHCPSGQGECAHCGASFAPPSAGELAYKPHRSILTAYCCWVCYWSSQDGRAVRTRTTPAQRRAAQRAALPAHLRAERERKAALQRAKALASYRVRNAAQRELSL